MNSKLPHDEVYVRLQPSTIHGIGCFAIRDIPEDIDPFLGSGSGDEYSVVDMDEIKELSPEIQKLYSDFCGEEDGKYYCPLSFNRMDIAWYLNHSKNPNVIAKDTGGVSTFVTMRPIKAGEELTVDYDTFK